MRSFRHRVSWTGCLLAALTLGLSGCTSSDTTSSLVDLTATTSGSLVQILVQAYLTHEVSPQDPNLAAPISTQQH